MNEVENKKEVEIVEYYRPKFWKRVSAIFLDAIVFALLAIGSFIAINTIVVNQPSYVMKNEILNDLKERSFLYEYNEQHGRYQDAVTYYNYQTNLNYSLIELQIRDRLENFSKFLLDEGLNEIYSNFMEDYNNERLKVSLTYNGIPYFVEIDGNIEKNKEISIPSKEYINNFYFPFFDKYALGYFVSGVPEVLNIQRYQANFLFFLEIPLAITISSLITYLIIPICIFRGRKTIGRFAFNLGLVDKRVLNVSWKRYLVRFLIQYFLEIILSLLTFGIPLIISFTMMAFSKKKQNFHDYMLGIEEVDTTNSKIYLSKKEIYKIPTSKYDVKKFNSINR